MVNQFNVVIGIEVHIVLNTKSKMFSYSKNCHNDPVNTNIWPIDLGHPGTMPLPNEECIKKGVILAHALGMQIASKIRFDRKNYFYQDLPKGFQITQNYNPIGVNGFINIDNNQSVSIERIHLEEDTAKQFIEDNKVFLDYNRSGLPLIEIVTNPVIKSAKDAACFLKKLRRILIFNNISDAKLEDGSMRADINISVNHKLSDKFGTRVEIKNINSISNVEKAIDYEIDRQIKCILSNKIINQETRKFNDKKNITEFMREKAGILDYHYMIEPNIFIRNISKEFVELAIKNNYQNVYEIEKQLINKNISWEFVNILLDDINIYKAFLFINDIVKNENEVVKWLCIELIGLISKENKTLLDIHQDKLKRIALMINLLIENKINGKQAKEILKIIYSTNCDLDEIIEKNNFKQITDEKIIEPILSKLLLVNQNMINQYESRPERVEKFFIGMVMKETNGQANPDVTSRILKKILNNKKDN